MFLLTNQIAQTNPLDGTETGNLCVTSLVKITSNEIRGDRAVKCW